MADDTMLRLSASAMFTASSSTSSCTKLPCGENKTLAAADTVGSRYDSGAAVWWWLDAGTIAAPRAFVVALLATNAALARAERVTTFGGRLRLLPALPLRLAGGDGGGGAIAPTCDGASNCNSWNASPDAAWNDVLVKIR